MPYGETESDLLKELLITLGGQPAYGDSISDLLRKSILATGALVLAAQNGGGGGASLPVTVNLIKGNGSGGGSDSGVNPDDVILSGGAGAFSQITIAPLLQALAILQGTTGPGTVATTGTATILTGTSTLFTKMFVVGDTITVSGETVRTIAAISSDTELTVTGAFNNTASGLSYTKAARTVGTFNGSGAFFTGGPVVSRGSNDAALGGSYSFIALDHTGTDLIFVVHDSHDIEFWGTWYAYTGVTYTSAGNSQVFDWNSGKFTINGDGCVTPQITINGGSAITSSGPGGALNTGAFIALSEDTGWVGNITAGNPDAGDKTRNVPAYYAVDFSALDTTGIGLNALSTQMASLTVKFQALEAALAANMLPGA